MAETIQVVIQGEDRLSKPAQAGSRALEGLQRSAQQTTGHMGLLSAAFRAPGAAIGGMVGALGKIGLAGMGVSALVSSAQQLAAPILQGVAAASDLNETVNKAQVVFGDAMPIVAAFGESSATALGMSKNQAIASAASFGNLFTTMGMGKKVSAEFSTNLLQNAADLASFNNIDPTEVLQKLQSGLVGEAEPLRALGIDVMDAAMAQEALRQGISKTTQDMTQAEKISLRYSLIQRQMANSAGDFARTSDGLANSQRIVAAQMANASAELGGAFMPAVVAVTAAISKMLPAIVKTLGPIVAEVGKFATKIGDWVATGLGKLPDILKTVASAFTAFGTEFSSVVAMVQKGDVFGAISKAFSGISGLVKPLTDRIAAVWASIDWGAVWASARNIGAGILSRLGSIAGSVTTWLKGQWALIDWGAVWSRVTSIGAGIVSSLGSIAGSVTTWLKEQWSLIDWPGVWGTITDMGGKLVKAAGDVLGSVQTWLGDQWALIDWPTVWSKVGDIARGLEEKIRLLAGAVQDWLGGVWAGINWPTVWSKVQNFAGGLETEVAKLGPPLLTAMQNLWANIDWGAVTLDNQKADEAMAEQIRGWHLGEAGKALGQKIGGLFTTYVPIALLAANPIGWVAAAFKFGPDVAKWIADSLKWVFTNGLYQAREAIIGELGAGFAGILQGAITGAWDATAGEVVRAFQRMDVRGEAYKWASTQIVQPIENTLSGHDWEATGRGIGLGLKAGLSSVTFDDFTAIEDNFRAATDRMAADASTARRALADAMGGQEAVSEAVATSAANQAAGLYAAATATGNVVGEAERYRQALSVVDNGQNMVAKSGKALEKQADNTGGAIGNMAKAMTPLERALASIQLKLGAFNLKDLEEEMAQMLKRKRPTAGRAAEAYDRAILEQQAAILQQKISIEGTGKTLGAPTGTAPSAPAGIAPGITSGPAITPGPAVAAGAAAAGVTVNNTGPLVAIASMVVGTAAEGQAAAKTIADAVTKGIASLVQSAGRASGAANPGLPGAARAI